VAVLLREVFIASNFAEFQALRGELRQRIDASGFARAIDLNDNAPDPRSPLRRSRGRVRSSDLVVLLVGQKYGEARPEGKLSYTHLEYREARSEGIQVLPYLIGPGYSKSESQPRSGDTKLHPLQRAVLDEHVAAFHESDSDPAQLADVILDAVREALLGARDENDGAEVGDESELLDRTSLGSGDLDALERGRDSAELSSELELLRRPAEAAAAEQLREARRALSALDRRAAIHHLRRALELRPLDPIAGYDLARLLLTSRHKDLREASRLAQRVARVAGLDGNEIRQGFALALAATAEASLGNEERARVYVSQAIKAADRIAAVHIECAFVLAKIGCLEEATKEAERAFILHPASFWKLSRDKVLGRSPQFRALAGKLLAETRETVTKILRVEQESATLARRICPEGADDEAARAQEAMESVAKLDLARVVPCGRESARRTLQMLRRMAAGLPAAASVADGLRRDAAQLVSERQTINAQPELPLDPALFDHLALWAPVALALLVGLGSGISTYGVILVSLFSLIAGAFLRKQLRSRQRTAKVESELSQLETRLGSADDLARRAEQDLEQALRNFAKLVARLERHAVAPPGGIFSPSVGTASAAIGRLVRIRPSTAPDNFILEPELFPSSSELPAPSSERPSNKAQLFMVIGREKSRWVAARWACYFEATERRASLALRGKLKDLGILEDLVD
jgi:tetratricopeptide (TPR) repeat protein